MRGSLGSSGKGRATVMGPGDSQESVSGAHLWEMGGFAPTSLGAVCTGSSVAVHSFSIRKWLDMASALSSSPVLLQSLLYFLEALEQVQIPIPKGKCLAVSSVVYSEVSLHPHSHSNSLLAESREDSRAPSLCMLLSLGSWVLQTCACVPGDAVGWAGF